MRLQPACRVIDVGDRQQISLFLFFFFNDTATTEIYTLSLHDALPIFGMAIARKWLASRYNRPGFEIFDYDIFAVCGDGCLMEGVGSEAASLAGHLELDDRSEEHTSELQSLRHLVCRLLLEKKKDDAIS